MAGATRTLISSTTPAASSDPFTFPPLDEEPLDRRVRCDDVRNAILRELREMTGRHPRPEEYDDVIPADIPLAEVQLPRPLERNRKRPRVPLGKVVRTRDRERPTSGAFCDWTHKRCG